MNTASQQQYMVHQIQLTSEESKAINKLGWDEAVATMPRVKAYMATMCHGAEKFVPEFWASYRHVSTITATGLEDVFKVGNIGPEEQIKRLASMHSVSVGNIVQLGGLFWMVNPEGFKEITDSMPTPAQDHTDPQRYAIIDSTNIREVSAYMPSNYKVAGIVKVGGSKPRILIYGTDNAGWTMDGYVLPRLGSGWIFGEETDSLNALALQATIEV
jgi:hypothetical protein